MIFLLLVVNKKLVRKDRCNSNDFLKYFFACLYLKEFPLGLQAFRLSFRTMWGACESTMLPRDHVPALGGAHSAILWPLWLPFLLCFPHSVCVRGLWPAFWFMEYWTEAFTGAKLWPRLLYLWPRALKKDYVRGISWIIPSISLPLPLYQYFSRLTVFKQPSGWPWRVLHKPALPSPSFRQGESRWNKTALISAREVPSSVMRTLSLVDEANVSAARAPPFGYNRNCRDCPHVLHEVWLRTALQLHNCSTPPAKPPLPQQQDMNGAAAAQRLTLVSQRTFILTRILFLFLFF